MKYQENKDCIEACLGCASASNHCAVSCLKEEESEVGRMTKCIRLNLECAMACYAASEMMTLGSDRAQEYSILCAELCEVSAKECSRFDNEHCREAARSCRTCAKLCREMAANVLAHA